MAITQTPAGLDVVTPEMLGVESAPQVPLRVPTDLPLQTIVQLDPHVRKLGDLPEMWNATPPNPLNWDTRERFLLEPTDKTEHRAMLVIAEPEKKVAHLKLPKTNMTHVLFERTENRLEGIVSFYISRISSKRFATLFAD